MQSYMKEHLNFLATMPNHCTMIIVGVRVFDIIPHQRVSKKKLHAVSSLSTNGNGP